MSLRLIELQGLFIMPIVNNEVCRYQYKDPTGRLLFEKIRYEPKTFRIVNPVTGIGNNGHNGALYNCENLNDIEGKRVYIVEGEKDVDTMTSLELLATTSGGASSWPAKNNDLFIGVDVCILPDNDEPGRKYAAKIKESLDRVARSVRIMFCPDPYKDVTDWVLDGGTAEQIIELFNVPIIHAFKTISFNDLLKLDLKPNWIVTDYIEKNSLCQIFGASGSGKSFFALDMAYCIAAGIDFFGKKVKKTNVLFIAGEGFSGLKKRAKALFDKYGADIECLEFSMQAAELMSQESCISVADRIKACESGFDVVFIDTLNRNMGAGDENSTKDMTQFISNIDRYIRSLGCAIIIVHHTGLNNADRGRGSGALYNALDTEFKVVKEDGGQMTITCTKQKEGESGWEESLMLMPVVVGHDSDTGEAIFSCVINKAVESLGSKVLKNRDQAVFDAFRHAVIAEGIDKTIHDIDVIVIELEQWKKEAYKRITGENKTRSFNYSKENLIKSGHILSLNGYFYTMEKLI